MVISTETWSKTKAMAALLSGEMKDTVDLNPAGAYGQGLHSVLSAIHRALLSDPRLQCLRDSFQKRNVNRSSAAGQAVRACGSKEVTQYGVMPRLHQTMRKEDSIHTESSSLFARRLQYHWMIMMSRHRRPRKDKRTLRRRKVQTSARYHLHGRT